MNEQRLTSVVDQLSTAAKEVFKEKGYNVKVNIAVSKPEGGMEFIIRAEGKPPPDAVIASVLVEAAKRVNLEPELE